MADAHAKPPRLPPGRSEPVAGGRRHLAPSCWRSALISWMHHMFAAAPLVFGLGVLGVLYTFIGWWRDVIREAQYEGYHTRVVQISHRYGMILFIASEVMFFVAWFWAYFNTALFPDALNEVARVAFTGGVWPPQGHRDLQSLAPAAAQHADPAHLRHHGDLGASRAAGERPAGAEMGPGADHPARPHLHLRAGLRIFARRLPLFSGNMYGATFFMATGFHGAHVIIGSIFLIVCLVRALKRPVHADPASRLRIRRLVLAFRRRGVAVPVRLHICVGRRRGASGVTVTREHSKGAAATPPFCF